MNGKNNMLEVMLEDSKRLLKFYLTKEKSVIEGEFLSFYLKAWAFILQFYLLPVFLFKNVRSLRLVWCLYVSLYW